MIKRFGPQLILAALLFIPAQARADAGPRPQLWFGSAAPAIKVSKWFKGTPVTEFKEGEVYVMEFWATWCGPCIAAMPHVTELAKTYEGKVTVVGVSVWERPDEQTDEAIAKLVAPFVEKQGERMVYNVAAEGIDHAMADGWLRAAGQNGIPCSMIIGRDRKIAWIGHPMELEKPLAQVVEGTFDVKLAEEEYTKKWQARQERQQLLEPITAARRAKDGAALVAAIDKAVAAQPDLEEALAPMRFEGLLLSDEPAAYAFMEKTAEHLDFQRDSAKIYNMWIAMSQQVDSLKNPAWSRLAELLAKCNEKVKDEPPLLAANADALARAGKLDQAIELQKKVVDLATAKVGRGIPEAWLANQKRKLEEYEAKKGQ